MDKEHLLEILDAKLKSKFDVSQINSFWISLQNEYGMSKKHYKF